MNMKGAFDSDEGFEDFLRGLAKSPEYREMRGKAEQGPHVPEPVLTEYVVERLDDEDQMRVMEHLSFCRSCSQSVRELRRTMMPVSGERADTTAVEAVSGHGFSRHFETDEGFIALLETLARDPETETLRKVAENGPHPSDGVLRAYSEDRADDAKVFELMEHLSLCRPCAERARIFRAHISDETLAEGRDSRSRAEIHRMREFYKILKELEDRIKPEIPYPVDIDFRTLDQLPAIAQAGIDLEPGRPPERPKEGAPVSAEPSGGTISVGETVILRISVQREGHIAVFHSPPGTGTAELLYPRGPRDDTSVAEGDVKQIPFEGAGPEGPHTVKVLWTAGRLLDPSTIDFKDRLELAQTVVESLRRVMGFGEQELKIVSSEFTILSYSERP